MDQETDRNCPASPPCFAHELELTENGYTAVDRDAAVTVARWRKAERERLVAARLAVSADDRSRVAEAVAAELSRLVGTDRGTMISLYWPFRGELDLRGWMRTEIERGMRIALPVVERKAHPLTFREWTPGCQMGRGVWNIPIPADGPSVTPDVVIAPLVGFDNDCYRLGYGGGFFDRTLAALSPRPLAIGVGHPSAAIATIYPQPYDIPMDVIVTGSGQAIRRGCGQ
ncbi:5-formyltetrahydrofolate cyclo-ligase [Thalassobaculum sp.]|uniref:5-formyltetrahydrofolate cyclo-ligase n=1 Tax=Thalassobaculum sp. TaxID=2022740 RepID=UPI0032EF8FC1